jgi:predicted N-acetyltransferase YhbS
MSVIEIQIIDLFKKPEHISIVADWIYHEFWKDKPGYTPEFFQNLLNQANSNNKIPISLLALVNGLPAGTINLIENDDEKRLHLKPWLAALYVSPSFRNRGVGSMLVKSLLKTAKNLDIKKLYLGTDNPDFYERLGATKFERAFLLCRLTYKYN